MAPERSRRWAQEAPRLADDGRADLDVLEGECSEAQRRVRALGFKQARRFVQQAEACGGLGPVSESFPRQKPPEHPDARVDIEVHAGIAFVPRRAA